MDVAQTVAVQARAEERVRFGNDINAAESEIQPRLTYDFIWKGGQNHFVALYQPRFIYTSAWNKRFPDPTLINPATLNQEGPNAHPVSFLQNGGAGLELL